QVPARGPDLLFDEVVVVDEPLGRGGDLGAALDGLGDDRVSVLERRLVGRQSRQQVIGAVAAGGVDLVPAGQRPRVLLELTDGEELRLHPSLVELRAGVPGDARTLKAESQTDPLAER